MGSILHWDNYSWVLHPWHTFPHQYNDNLYRLPFRVHEHICCHNHNPVLCTPNVRVLQHTQHQVGELGNYKEYNLWSWGGSWLVCRKDSCTRSMGQGRSCPGYRYRWRNLPNEAEMTKTIEAALINHKKASVWIFPDWIPKVYRINRIGRILFLIQVGNG